MCAMGCVRSRFDLRFTKYDLRMVMKTMLQLGADPNEVQEEVEEVTGTIYYRIPLDWVERGRHDECAAIIRKAGGGT